MSEKDEFDCRQRDKLIMELRTKEKEITELRAELETAHRYNADSMYERDALRADKEQLQRSLDHINDCCLRAEAERDQLKAQLAKTQSE